MKRDNLNGGQILEWPAELLRGDAWNARRCFADGEISFWGRSVWPQIFSLGSVGGTLNGPGQCVGCYLSVQNNQQVTAAEGIDYNFYGAGTVICSVVGTWWGGGPDPMGVGLHRTSYQSDGSPTNCTLTPTCPAGQTPVCGAQSFSTGSACQGPWMSILYLGTIDNRTKSRSCYGVGKPVWRSQIGTCD